MPPWQGFRDHAEIRWTWQAELRCVWVVLDCLKESDDVGSPTVLAEKKNKRIVSEKNSEKKEIALRSLSIDIVEVMS